MLEYNFILHKYQILRNFCHDKQWTSDTMSARYGRACDGHVIETGES